MRQSRRSEPYGSHTRTAAAPHTASFLRAYQQEHWYGGACLPTWKGSTGRRHRRFIGLAAPYAESETRHLSFPARRTFAVGLVRLQAKADTNARYRFTRVSPYGTTPHRDDSVSDQVPHCAVHLQVRAAG